MVSDCLGLLYNKDSILEWLLRGLEAFGDGEEVLGGRVKSLRDVVPVRFESLPDDLKADSESARAERWVCPVSRKELGSGVKSVYIVPCGHAFAESAVREVGGSESGCLVVSRHKYGPLLCLVATSADLSLSPSPQCSQTYDAADVIPINPEEPKEVERLQERVKGLVERGLTHSLKKPPDKKSKKRKSGPADANGAAEANPSKPKKTKEAGIRNAAAAALTSKVLEDEKLKHQQRKLDMSESVKSLFTKPEAAKKPSGGNSDFMSRGYTLPDVQ